MATAAVANGAVLALRREIARIEGRPPERLEPSRDAGGILVRHAGLPGSAEPVVTTGAERFDAALGGGLPRAALVELHGRQTREAGAVTGFALALAARARLDAALPVLWIATVDMAGEAGLPYAPGLARRFGIPAEAVLVSTVRAVEDALWVAEEAAGLTALSAVLLEMRGHARGLDLTATRRLSHRTRGAGRPFFLLRHAAGSEPTAAPLRLLVSPAPAAERRILSGSLSGSIGPPAFDVAVSKCSFAPPASFTLEWNADERAFCERPGDHRQAAHPRPVVSLSAERAPAAQTAGNDVAFEGAA